LRIGWSFGEEREGEDVSGRGLEDIIGMMPACRQTGNNGTVEEGWM